VHKNGITLDAALHGFLTQQLYAALGWATRYLRLVRIALTDVNGPRSGIDKRCRIEAKLHSGKEVVVEHTEVELKGAIERALQRADRVIARCLQRKHMLLRNPRCATLHDEEPR
jgi:hypothetical protein